MSDFIIAVSIADTVWDEDPESGTYNPQPQPSVEMARNATHVAYLSGTDTGWPVSSVIVGEWDVATGEPLRAITSAYTDWIRPLGNVSGAATGPLDSMKWQGHPEEKFFEYSVDDTDPENPIVTSEKYPATNRPFSLKIERTLITDDGFPATPHGWKVTMLSEDPLRDITARAIGIYTDADAYLYTTGAFVDDGNGTFFTECPVGQRTADEVDIYFKLLLGSAPEGAWTVPVGNADSEALFWSSDQTPVGGSWQDSGETVVSLVGAGVIEVSDTAPFSAGQAIRILSTEATVDSVFTPGAPGVLTISPHIAVTGGETIEIFA